MTKQALEIDDDPETFQNMIALVNFYGETLLRYHKALMVLNSIPRQENGDVLLGRAVQEVIHEMVDTYPVILTYAEKLMDTEITVH